MRCLAVLGGEFIGDSPLNAWAEQCDLIIGVDAGADHCRRAGIAPDLVVGDLDSVEDRQVFDPKIVQIDRDEDRSDFEKMLTTAKRHGAREVVLICAHGGRIDHLLAGFSAAIATDLSVRWVFPQEHALLIRPGFQGKFSTGVAKRFSLMPTRGASVVSCSGARWNLNNQRLELGEFWSLSNETTSTEFELRVEEAPVLLLVEANPSEIPAW